MVDVENKSYLPACWSDETRMNALFAPFRPKSLNPESWNSKMAFWSDALKSWCIHKNDAAFSESEARNAFTRDGRRPACLDTLIVELQKQGSIMPPSFYSSAVESSDDGWIGWGTRKAFRPVGYALSFVASYIVNKEDEIPLANRKFVFPAVVKNQAESLLGSYADDSETIGTVEELMESSAMRFPSEESFKVVLGYLLGQKLASRKGQLFKLSQGALKRAQPITEADESRWRLNVAIRNVSRSVGTLEAQIEEAHKAAKGALAAGDRIAAKGHLRRKHAKVGQHAKCLDTLDNLRTLTEALRQTEAGADVIDTYRSSVRALRKTMVIKKVSEDDAYDTMDDLKEVLDSCIEIETTISKPVEDFDAGELERELADLLAADAGDTPASPHGGNTSVETWRIHTPASPHGGNRSASSDETRRILEELPEVPGGGPKAAALDPKSDPRKSKLPVAVAADVPADTKEDPARRRQTEEARRWYPAKDVFAQDTGVEPDTNPRSDLSSILEDKRSARKIDGAAVRPEPRINELERRLQDLRGLSVREPELDLADLDSEDDEALSNGWPSNERRN